jgi:hypothetical protein
MTGGVSVSLITTVRGALGNKVCGASGVVAARLVVTTPTARPELINRIERVFIEFPCLGVVWRSG